MKAVPVEGQCFWSITLVLLDVLSLHGLDFTVLEVESEPVPVSSNIPVIKQTSLKTSVKVEAIPHRIKSSNDIFRKHRCRADSYYWPVWSHEGDDICIFRFHGCYFSAK